MSELFFFTYTYKGVIKPYYKKDNKISDLLGTFASEEIRDSILNDSSIKYYLFDDIINNIESVPLVVNIIYTDADNFHSTYAIFSTTNNSKLKIITLEDLQFDIDEYIPHEIITLNSLPRKYLPLDWSLAAALNDDIRLSIGEMTDNISFRIEHIKISPYSDVKINPKTGLPEYILHYGLHVKFMEFNEFQKMLEKKRVYRYFIDDDIQKWAKESNKILFVFGINGITYLLNAQYDKEKDMISPPL